MITAIAPTSHETCHVEFSSEADRAATTRPSANASLQLGPLEGSFDREPIPTRKAQLDVETRCALDEWLKPRG